MCPAGGDRLRVRPPLREVVVRPPVDPAEATETPRDGGRLLGDIMLLGIFTGRTESVGEESFRGLADIDIVEVDPGAPSLGGVEALSSSFFSSSLLIFEGGSAVPSFGGFSLVSTGSAFAGVSAVILELFLVSRSIINQRKQRMIRND